MKVHLTCATLGCRESADFAGDDYGGTMTAARVEGWRLDEQWVCPRCWDEIEALRRMGERMKGRRRLI